MKQPASLATTQAVESPIPVKGYTKLRQMSKRENLPKRFKRPRVWRPR